MPGNRQGDRCGSRCTNCSVHWVRVPVRCCKRTAITWPWLTNGLWVDVGVVAGATVTDPAGLQVFRPTLLDDLDGLDPAFDGWLEEQRQRVTQLALSVTEAVLAAESETKARIAAAERLLTIDRAHEGAWQALIRAHLELGDRAAARLAFERCSTTLSHAGLAPSRETEALVRSTSPLRRLRSLVPPARRFASA